MKELKQPKFIFSNDPKEKVWIGLTCLVKSSLNVILRSFCSSKRLQGTNFVLILLPVFQKNPTSHLLVNVNLILYGSFDNLWQPMQ